MPTELLMVGERFIECRRWDGSRGAPTLVLLHEGLGSVSAWGDLPGGLAAATGCPVFAYSRPGYGRSSAARLPLHPRYMHEEGTAGLPETLAAAGIDDYVLVGHSDGASIALLHLATRPAGARAAVLLAPHVFNEPRCLDGIRRAGVAFRVGTLRSRLARHHPVSVDRAFRGWYDAWTSPAFLDWNIAASLPEIEKPLLVVQGSADPYGTTRQVDTIESTVRAPVSALRLDECGHAPHRERPAATLAATIEFVRRATDAGGPTIRHRTT